jgi:ABC-type Fe3+/spermidine/putrescine transport system ATPase subunit
MTKDTPAIRLDGLRKTFGPVEAVAGIDLEIADGEFFWVPPARARPRCCG